MRIAGLFDHSQACRNLRLAFRPGAGGPTHVHLEFLSSWKKLRRGVRQGDYDLAFVQPCLGRVPGPPEPNLAELERVAAFLPRDHLILYLCSPDPAGALLRELGRLGFPFIMLLGSDDNPGNLLRIVARARARSVLQNRLAPLGSEVEDNTLRLALETLAGWPPPASVEELADNLNLSRRSLTRAFQTAGLPAPGRLMSAGKLLEAHALSRLGVRSRARMAEVLGLAEPASLGRLSRRLAERPFHVFLDPESGEDLFDWVVGEIRG